MNYLKTTMMENNPEYQLAPGMSQQKQQMDEYLQLYGGSTANGAILCIAMIILYMMKLRKCSYKH